VYDVTDFLDQHPGSAYLDYLGSDVTDIFRSESVHDHSAEAMVLLDLFEIGILQA
jgi:cytochrome b involved in lipid metabolism